MVRVRRTSRKTEGYALVSIIVIGLFAIMLLLALGSMLVSIAQSEAVSKHKAGLLNAAETGLEYVLYDIKRANSADEPTYDFGDDSPPVTVNVPTSWLDDDQMTVKARVWKVRDEDLQNAKNHSLLWSPQIDPSQADTSSYGSPVRSKIQAPQSEFFHTKVVEVTASRGVFSKSIRAIAMPSLNSGASPANFPDVGILAVSNLTVAPKDGALDIKMYALSESDNPTEGAPARYKLDLQSNKEVSLIGGSNPLNIGGNVIVSNNSAGAPDSLFTGDNDIRIHGRLETNGGSLDNLNFQPGPNYSRSENVWANADEVANNGEPTPREGVNQNPIDLNAGGSGKGVDPVPTIGEQEVSTEDGTTSNNWNAYLNTLPDSEKIIGSGSSEKELSFIADSLVVNDPDTTIKFDALKEVKIYIQGNNSEEAVNIDASRIKYSESTTPANFQIYYNGSNQVNITLNGSPFKGMIYAPNATVQVSNGNNTTGSFDGAIVGDKVNVLMSGQMNLIADPSSLGGDSDSGGSLKRTRTVYKVASYQEVNGKLVE